MELAQIIDDVADGLVAIDASGVSFKEFQPGAGPYGEPQLVRLIADQLNRHASYEGRVATKRTPDLLIRGRWALEFKLARPFGDNGREAENWSVNLLHPYEGNASVLGDCMKLLDLQIPERKAVVVVGFEHTPPRISLSPLIDSFEVIAERVLHIRLGPRVQVIRQGLVHPVHQQVTVTGWEVLVP